jgi:predicted ATP-binding protein involved in virulence
MKLKNVQITNFRCFESISIDFDEKLTVLVAENGAGKTAILDAVAVALSPFIGGFDTGIGKGFKHEDARLVKQSEKLAKEGKLSYELELQYAVRMESQYPISLDASGFVEEKTTQWSRELTGKKNQTTFGMAKVLTNYAKKLQQQVRLGESITLPVIAYYGTGRLLKQNQINSKSSTESQSRLYGYHDALNPNSNYKSFEKWFIDKKIAEINASNQRMLNYLKNAINRNEGNELFESFYDRELQYIRAAINQCLSISGWNTLEYDTNWKKLVVRNDAKAMMPVSQLSDGVKAMLSLVADVAYRCVQLNPHLSSPSEETEGIVLIDEIDLHLHPKWQQTVLSDLCKAFPNIQFIVTTHSPQVLSSTHRKSIRLLGKDANGKDVAVMPIAESYGELSSDVLQSIMHVNPQPPVAEKSDLEYLTALVDQGLYNTPEATTLFNNLKAALSETHPQLQKLARSIKRQELLKA